MLPQARQLTYQFIWWFDDWMVEELMGWKVEERWWFGNFLPALPLRQTGLIFSIRSFFISLLLCFLCLFAWNFNIQRLNNIQRECRISFFYLKCPFFYQENLYLSIANCLKPSILRVFYFSVIYFIVPFYQVYGNTERTHFTGKKKQYQYLQLPMIRV